MLPRTRPAAELELDKGRGVRVRLILAGPSFHGWVYRSVSAPEWYRLLTIPDEQDNLEGAVPADCAPLARRHDIQSWIGLQHAGAAPIAAAGQSEDGQFFYVQYQIEAGRLLQDALEAPDPFIRLHYGLLTLRALPRWWQQLYLGLMPMPVDVVFSRDDTPYLLALPPWRPPDAAAVFAEPARALYLAPELIRGRGGSPDNLDRYAVGVALLQCFGKARPSPEVTSLLARAATGSALGPQQFDSDWPYWLARVPATQEALNAVRRLVDPDPQRRGAIHPEHLARQLEEYRQQMAPDQAVRWLLNLSKTKEAFDLLQDILLAENSYELLLLSAEIAGAYLRRHLEAIDFYDRAIERHPQRPEAYAGQFRMILAAREQIAHFPPEEKAALNAQLDDKLHRDFANMAEEEQLRHEEDMAREVLIGRHYEEAADFIFPRIVINGEHQWWRFDLNLFYVAALLGQDRLADARQELERTKAWLVYARQSGALPPRDVDYHGETLANLEIELRHKEVAQGSTPP